MLGNSSRGEEGEKCVRFVIFRTIYNPRIFVAGVEIQTTIGKTRSYTLVRTMPSSDKKIAIKVAIKYGVNNNETKCNSREKR